MVEHGENEDFREFGEEKKRDLSKPVSMEDVNKTLNSALAPRGTYNTNPMEFGPMLVTTANQDFGQDRFMVLLSGRVTGTIKGESYTAFCNSFKLSPDTRKQQKWENGVPVPGEFSDKDDAPSRRWAEAAKAYFSTHKAVPTEQEVLDFLANGEYKLELRQFNGRLILGKIKSMKDR